ncbi:MAG TPA: hypothetical protein VF412_00605 [Bdellovibrio sp.]|uniref:hypothetical protein n=1 Tax=Bdellovibrio sp. TaxID=28201 RepID=UPI002EEC5141
MSGHHKNKGFSQTSKRYDGALKAQHQQARNKQADHSADAHDELVEDRSKSSSSSKK